MTRIEKARHMLETGDATEKATALLNISYWEEVPAEILDLVDQLRKDRSIARMYAPFRYGELGYLASRVYALVRYSSGVREPITIRDTAIPLKVSDLSRICDDNGIDIESDDPVNWFSVLRSRGLLPLEDVTFDERSFDLEE